MTLYLETIGGFMLWRGEAIKDVRHPTSIEDVWTADELADIGLYVPVRPAVPNGKVVVNEHVERVGGIVTYVYELESVPLRDLNRIQFEFMIEKLGIGPAIEGAIAAMPEGDETEQNAKILARVLYRSGQNFERGHPLFSELAPAVGFTSQQVDAAWLAALSV